MRRNERAATIKDALRKRFKSPREAALALNLDEKLLDVPRLALDGAKNMAKTKPTRLEYLLVTSAARALNPLLATDAKVEYGPIFKGVTTKTLKARKATIIGDVKKAIKGKTIAKDATVEHLAHMLDQFEHAKEPKSLDESVSGEQHRAMEAAAHGHSNLGIPKNVGQEFERADKGHKFSDAIPSWLKGKGMSDDDCAHVMDMIRDEMPENALDEGENVEIEVEEAEDEIEEEEAEDGEIEQEEAEDEIEQEEGEDAHPARDARHGRDSRRGARDAAMNTGKKPITEDAMNAALGALEKKMRKNAQETTEARAFVRPFVGEVSMALDSADGVYRAAAEHLGIEDVEKMPAVALRKIIELAANKQTVADGGTDLAHDSATGGTTDSLKRWPDAGRLLS